MEFSAYSLGLEIWSSFMEKLRQDPGVLFILLAQSAENRRFFPPLSRAQLSRPLEFRSTPSNLFSLKREFEHSELESHRDVSVTRIDDYAKDGGPEVV